MTTSRPIVLDLTSIFVNPTSASATVSSPLKSRLESWSPTRKKDIADIFKDLEGKTTRRDAMLSKKVSSAHRESKADCVKREYEAAAARLKGETDKKLAEALARAESKKADTAAKGAKMANIKVASIREEEAASVAFTKEMNEKRHADALTRAASAKKARSDRAYRESKADRVKAATEAAINQLKIETDKKLSEALVRAQAAKAVAAAKGAKMSASKLSAVKARTEATADAKQKALLARQAAAAERALEIKHDKQVKAVRLATPVRKRGLSTSPSASPSALSNGLLSPAEIFATATPSKSTDPVDDGHFPCPPPIGSVSELPALCLLPPAPPSAEEDIRAGCAALQIDPILVDDTSPHGGTPEETAAFDRGGSLKVVTLRRDSPTGNHVISIITSALEGHQAEELVAQVSVDSASLQTEEVTGDSGDIPNLMSLEADGETSSVSTVVQSITPSGAETYPEAEKGEKKTEVPPSTTTGVAWWPSFSWKN